MSEVPLYLLEILVVSGVEDSAVDRVECSVQCVVFSVKCVGCSVKCVVCSM